MSLSERREHVKKNKLCFNCLKGNHVSRECRKPKQCNVSGCHGKHHPLFHSWVPSRSDHTVVQSSVNCAASNNASVKTCLGIIPVTVTGSNGYSCQTYALLDDGADKSLCDERLIRKLNIPSKDVTFKISTINSTGGMTTGKEVDLTVSPISGENNVSLHKVRSVKQLPISIHSAATAEEIRKIPYLSDLDIPNVKSSDVMLLIGTDTPDAHIPLEERTGEGNQPNAVRTRVGWAVRGPITMSEARTSVNINFGHSMNIELQQQLENMWLTDFSDRTFLEKESMSVEDKRALRLMESTLEFKNGHYELGLPWRDESPALPNNLALAQARLQQLKRKLTQDNELHDMYKRTISDYIEKGYAEEVPNDGKGSSPVWYLPHHPVINVNKPGKIRVVFDCAAKYKDASLNSKLLQGPDMTNNLVGVLTRFRQDPIALAADIEAMFHQVRVRDRDCDALRFLWWPDGDMTKVPKTYRMKVHLFGATSSPSCAAYALRRTASDNSAMFTPEVVSTLRRNFYVDDCLKSVGSTKQAIKLAEDLRTLTSLGGFRLTKWVSNSRTVLESIPESERAPSVACLNPGDPLPCERALGVGWNVNEDKMTFRVKLKETPCTRRGILSIVSSVFDPLGLVSPVTLTAKAIVQNLCRKKIGWDENVPSKESEEWQRWLKRLPSLEELSIDRCYRPQNFGEVTDTQLHVFSDGSELGYGACAYLRMADEHGRLACTLVIGKSRLAPLKQMSIPRLELSGAVVACRLYAMLSEELDMPIDKVVFWTDSMIILGYINNVSRRFKTFVGNRLSYIHETSSPDQWRYVDSNSNPADIASRGLDPDDANGIRSWLNGPEFLLRDESTWPKCPGIKEVQADDLEVKKEAIAHTTTIQRGIDDLLEHYSDWTRLKRAVAWLKRFRTYIRLRCSPNSVEAKKGDITSEEVESASKAILQYVQMTHFGMEQKALKKGIQVKGDSRIADLNPILVNGLLRVYGRHNHKNYSDCPIVLPSKHYITEIIIRHYHKNNGHVGRQQVLAEIRTKYWILRGPSTVKKVVGACIPCRRQHSPLLTQQMAPLLEEQTTPDKPPFTYVGVDYFGPLMVKSGRSTVKRYGCLFTCLTTRAVHIEIAHGMTTDSFIAAYNRFTSRRGFPEKMYSDNGTNIVSGDKELKRSIEEWNKSKIGQALVQNGVEWHFNPPYASHMGGAWERLIRTTRTILKSLVREQLLTDEKLLTVMAETERILNNRPITQVSTDPNDPPALSPNTLLLMKTKSSIPVGVFRKEDAYCKRWWRQIQYLADVFWKRWIKEYIPSLQKRQKWQKKTRDIQIGDIVLVAEVNIPRGQWPLARVTDVIKGRDGHIRSCVVKTKNACSVKPISKLCLLEGSD